MTYFENSNLLQENCTLKIELLFTESHFEITIMAFKCQIYACTKSRLCQGSNNEGDEVRQGAHVQIKSLHRPPAVLFCVLLEHLFGFTERKRFVLTKDIIEGYIFTKTGKRIQTCKQIHVYIV